MIDVRALLQHYSIEYVEKGANVRQGAIAIACPLCGDDPSQHMNINYEKGNFWCWRNSAHKGDYKKLLRHVLKLPQSVVESMIGQPTILSRKQLIEKHKRLTTNKSRPVIEDRQWPKEFQKMDPNEPLHKLAVNHLKKKRHFSTIQIQKLYTWFGIRYSLSGPFAFRVIFPLTRKGKLVGFTGRTVNGSEQRYWTDDGGWGKALIYAPRIRPIVIVVEGPFDALRINYTARRAGLPVCAWAFMGTAITNEQIGTMLTMFKEHSIKEVWCLMDRNADAIAVQTANRLAIIRPKPRLTFLPKEFKDAGEMNHEACLSYLRTLLENSRTINLTA